jgi:hypothetical protein
MDNLTPWRVARVLKLARSFGGPQHLHLWGSAGAEGEAIASFAAFDG